jgi:hypothetical protein
MFFVTTMAAVSPSFELEITKLKQFHATHFIGQPVPNISSASAQRSMEQAKEAEYKENEEYDDGLGYYQDGVERTLTEEQVKMFRHSEVQRLLAARRRDAETKNDDRSRSGDLEEEKNDKHAAQAKVANMSSMNKARASGVSSQSKRKAHFDEPQDENTEVMLDY